MKKALMLAIMGLGLLLQIQGQSIAEYKAMFWKQMASSCTGNMTWEKSVTDISDGTKPAQAIAFQIDCAAGKVVSEGKPANLPWQEFSYLFDSDVDNPYLAPKLEVKRGPDGLHAVPKAEEVDCPLKLLHFEVVDGRIRKAEVKVEKANALYDMKVHTEVLFNADGSYRSHVTKTFSDVMLGGDVQTLIQGRILP